jgi:hypothetical protein
MALSNEFPGFYQYAVIMEEAAEAERQKSSRSYDGLQQFNETHKKMMSNLLTNAATIERGYQSLLESGKPLLDSSRSELNTLHQRWLADIESFRNLLIKNKTETTAMEYVDMALDRIVQRIAELEKRTHCS